MFSKKRLTAVFSLVLFCFQIESALCSTPSSKNISITIPPNLGITKESYKGSTKKKIIHIQDAHCIYNIQKNIASLLEYLKEKDEVTLIGMEGVADKIDTSAYQSFPLKNVRIKVSDMFLKKGIITGTEYFAINNDKPVVIWGIDDAQLYKQNLTAYISLLDQKKDASDLVDSLKGQLMLLGDLLYTDSFKEFQKKLSLFEINENQDNVLPYVQYLRDNANKEGIDTKSLTHFNIYLNCLELEKKFDPDKAQMEFEQVYAKIKSVLPAAKQKEFIEKDFYAKINRISQLEYYDYIEKLSACLKLNLTEFADFKNYVAYLKTIDGLHYGELIKECKQLEDYIADKMLVSDEQKECARFSKAASILNHFFTLELSQEDIAFLKKYPDYFIAQNLYSYLDKTSEKLNMPASYEKNPELLDKSVELLSQFYFSAQQRDEAMISNLLKLMENQKIDTAILVAGGFHTSGLTDKLKEKGIGYQVVTPRANSMPETSNYLELLTGKNMAEELFNKAAAQSLALASWMADTPIVNEQRKRELGKIFRANFVGNTVSELARTDVNFFKDGIKEALNRANTILTDWQVKNAPEVSLKEVRKIGSVIFARVKIDNTTVVFAYYNQLDLSSRTILPNMHVPLDYVVEDQIVQEILPLSTYKHVLQTAPKFADNLSEDIPLAKVQLGKSGRYMFSMTQKSLNRISKRADLMEVIKDIGRNVPNKAVEARLQAIEKKGNNKEYLEVFLAYYGTLVSSITELLRNQYPWVDDKLWFQLGFQTNAMTSIDEKANLVMLDINSLRSTGLLFAQIEQGFLFNVLQPHIIRAMNTLEMSQKEIEESKFAVTQFFVMLRKLERYQSYGMDQELGKKTLGVMFNLAGTPLIDPKEISMVGMNDEEQFKKAINLVKEQFPAYTKIMDKFQAENMYFLKAIKLKLDQSLTGVKGQFEFAETQVQNVIDIGQINTVDDAAKVLKKYNVQMVEIKFIDPQGKVRGVMAPIGEINDLLENGIPFDGSSIRGFGYIYQSDMVASLDPTRLKVYRAEPGKPIRASIWAVPKSPDENQPHKLTEQINFREEPPQAQTKEDVIRIMEEKGIKSARFAIVDSTGHLKYVSVSLSDLKKGDVWNKGISVPSDISLLLPSIKSKAKLKAVPDPTTLRVLDWSDGTTPEAIMYINLVTENGKPYEGDFRNVLKKVIDKAKNKGFVPTVAPEPEFFLLDKNGNPADTKDYYYDLEGVSENIRNTLQGIMIASESIGMNVRYAHHEVPGGQYEIPMKYSNDALWMADTIMIYKDIVRRSAEKNGLKSSFKAKVRQNINGSGMHVHQSLRSTETGDNLFFDRNDDMRLSLVAKQYSEGLMRHAHEIAALTNQHPNSYMRLTPGFEAPTAIAWGKRNRSALVRIPGFPDEAKGAARIEYRCPDPMGTSHLTFAAMIMAGIDGIEKKMTPRKPVETNIYKMNAEERKKAGITSLPTSMDEAIDNLEASDFVKSFLPQDVINFLIIRGRGLKDVKFDIGKVNNIEDVAKNIDKYQVEFVEIKFLDPEGKTHSVLAPVEFTKGMLEDGVGFDGSSIPGFSTVSKSDMSLRVEPSSLSIYQGQNGSRNHAEIWANTMKLEDNPTQKLTYPIPEYSQRTIPRNQKELIQMLEKNGITEVRFAITDHQGHLLFEKVSLRELKKGDVLKTGINMREEVRKLLPTTRDTIDFRALPDISSLRILDFGDGSKKEAYLFVDILDENGKPLPTDYRNMLKNMEQKANSLLNATPLMAPEPEFFLLKADGTKYDDKGYYTEIGGLGEDMQNALQEILRAIQSVGIDARYVHHEVANSQYEIPVGVGTALEVADSTMLFKLIIGRVANKYGLKATFQAKVFPDQNGSGMHVHQSLKNNITGVNMFSDPSDPLGMGLSNMAKSYIEGLLKYGPEIAALTNQTQNSYRRLVPGYEAPTAVAWGAKNRTASVRIPGWTSTKQARIEYRTPDPYGNTHLAFAAMLAAGLKGIEDNLQVRRPITSTDPAGGNIYHMTDEERKALGVGSLPTSLPQAIRWLNEGTLAKEIFGNDLMEFILRRSYYELGELQDIGRVESADDVLKVISENNVDFVEVKFMDPEGRIRGVYAPVGEIASLLKDGLSFDGSSIAGFGYISKSDMVSRLEPSTMRVFVPENGQPTIGAIWAVPMKPEENVPREIKTKDNYNFREKIERPNNNSEAFELLEKEGIEKVNIAVTDMSGELKFFSVPSTDFRKTGPFSDGVAIPAELIKDFGDTDVSTGMTARLQPNSLRILNWQDGSPKEAFVYADILMPNGKPFRSDPRQLLKKALEEALEMGFIPVLAPEPEFFLLNPDGSLVDQNKYYDVFSGGNKNVLKTVQDIIRGAESIGVRIKYAHHEVAPSQYEIPMDHDTAMDMADNIMIYKEIVKRAAKRHGLIALFNAKVFPDQNGSGMHVHQSLKRISTGENAFAPAKETPTKLSPIAESYVEGILQHAAGIMPLTNQNPNSYERLVPGFEAPILPVWGPKNRSAMVRIPGWPEGSKGAPRIEFRMPDPMGTAHLQFAAMIHAGLMGIKSGLKPREPISQNVYKMTEEERAQKGIVSLPATYVQAIKSLENDPVMRGFVGEGIIRYLKLRANEMLKRKSMDEVRLASFKVRVDEFNRIQVINENEQKEILQALSEQGIQIVVSPNTYISPEIPIGEGTIINSDVTITGTNIFIGKNVVIGEGVRIENSSDNKLVIHDGTTIGSGVLISGSDTQEVHISGNILGGDLIGFSPALNGGTPVEGPKPLINTGVDKNIRAQRLLQESI